jgi:hypothetical protein
MVENTSSEMKQMTLKLTVPLTIISMFLITKWWFVLPIDGPDKLYWGFPLAFMGEGFHTSMSLQFFVLEFLADFMVYFSVVFLLVVAFTKWFPALHISKIITKIVWVLTFVLLIGFSIIVATSNPIFKIKRNYDWHVMATGHVFIFQATPRPDNIHYQNN